MAQDINKPTGNGYQGTWTRRCTMCGHGDMQHYGKMGCLAGDCHCIGFAARDLSYEEIEIIRAPQKPGSGVVAYVGESLEREVRAEVERQKHAPIPKLPTLTKEQLSPAEEALKQWQ